jgi:hypothetical protein
MLTSNIKSVEAAAVGNQLVEGKIGQLPDITTLNLPKLGTGGMQPSGMQPSEILGPGGVQQVSRQVNLNPSIGSLGPGFNSQLSQNGIVQGSTESLRRAQSSLSRNGGSSTRSDNLISSVPRGIQRGRPTSSRVPLRPPSLDEALYGPASPNTLFGELTLDIFDDDTIQFTESFDNVSESTIRAICNTTSQIGAILCDDYVRNPQGGILAGIDGNNIARGCLSTRYGCCSNNTTAKLTREGSNCSSRNDLECGRSLYGCCPSTRIKRGNLIGTNCPSGAVPLVGWDQNSTLEERYAVGVGYRDPRFIGTAPEFSATPDGTVASANQLRALDISQEGFGSLGGGAVSFVDSPVPVSSSNPNIANLPRQPNVANNLGISLPF